MQANERTGEGEDSKRRPEQQEGERPEGSKDRRKEAAQAKKKGTCSSNGAEKEESDNFVPVLTGCVMASSEFGTLLHQFLGTFDFASATASFFLFFVARARCLSAGLRYLRLTRLPRHDRGPVPGRNQSAASCLCTVLRRALYHYATRSPTASFFGCLIFSLCTAFFFCCNSPAVAVPLYNYRQL